VTVTLLTASAGTGKTHRLVDEIERALTDKDAPLAPEHLVAVTYTRRAAAELDERVRRRLMEVGRVDLAHRLGAARIGTVHAVCQRLVEDYAFELGLSPDLRTLDERLAEHVLSDVLAAVLTDDELGAIEELGRRMDEMRSFSHQLKSLVDQARAQGLSVEELARAGERSRARLRSLLPGPVGDAAEIEDAFLAAIEHALKRAEHEDGPLNDRDVRTAREVAHALRNGQPAPWSRWLSLSRLGPPARAHVLHPTLREDMLRAHDLLYGVASRGLAQYAQSKRAWGVVDFVDQELHALTILRRVDLRARLAEDIRFVLVDEVQDTSPQQLEIFRALTRIAERSFWVGDRKQSIFGFRGADPSVLQDAVAHDVTETSAPLSISRRSRRPLVALTSAVFSRAFSQHDPEAGEATLESVLADDDAKLGAFLEWWDFEQVSDRRERERVFGRAIARGVVGLIGDEPAQVRDRVSGAIRAARAGDIAILVRRNTSARRVARALADVGVRAVLRRFGLGRSLEARLVRAALTLWLDARDVLSAAEIARVLEETEPQALMARLAQPDEWAQGLASRIREVAERERGAGVVRAFDLVSDALDLSGWCARVDEGPQRRANLAALRALAVRTVEEAHARGRGATVAAFIARLDELAQWHGADEDDRVGVVDEGDAVHIATWHGAKGLEWPIVVLGELEYKNPASVFGLATERDGDKRWPRCWPSPYRARQEWIKGGLFEALKDSPEAVRARREGDAEELRLLYVAWTRARDRLVLAGSDKDLERGPLALLAPPSLGRRTRWAGVDVACAVRRLVDEPHAPPPADAHTDYAPATRARDVPAFLQPSASDAVGAVMEEVVLGDPLVVSRYPDEEEATQLGSALHAIFGAWRVWDAADRFELVDGALARHRVTGILDVATCVRAAERLFTFLNGPLAASQTLTELPILHALTSGSLVRGHIDLLARTAHGDVLVDHKTYVADAATSREKAASFAGQLRMYADAVRASGRVVPSTWIHMPIIGRMYRVE
jgi:ATP-dependent helicase/nuclease subunit A